MSIQAQVSLGEHFLQWPKKAILVEPDADLLEMSGHVVLRRMRSRLVKPPEQLNAVHDSTVRRAVKKGDAKTRADA